MNFFLPLADLILHCLQNIVGQIWGAYNHWSYQRTKRVGEWDTIVFDDFPTKVSRNLWHLFGQQEVKIRVKKCPGETEMLCSSFSRNLHLILPILLMSVAPCIAFIYSSPNQNFFHRSVQCHQFIIVGAICKESFFYFYIFNLLFPSSAGCTSNS